MVLLWLCLCGGLPGAASSMALPCPGTHRLDHCKLHLPKFVLLHPRLLHHHSTTLLGFLGRRREILSCHSSPGPGGDIPRPSCLPSPFWGAVWEGVEGLPTCTMKSQSSTSKATSFTPSPCFTRCSPISARSRNSHRHKQNCFALPGPFPTPSPPGTPTLIPWVQSGGENKHDLPRKRSRGEDGATDDSFRGEFGSTHMSDPTSPFPALQWHLCQGLPYLVLFDNV